MLESTPHAVVRASVDANQTDTLLRILNHPLQVRMGNFTKFLLQLQHSVLVNFKKSGPKKLVKSNKLISRKKFSPLQFGVIPDDYTHVYLLNHFLKAENYRDAAKVGILLMLQEDYIPIGKLHNALNK